MLEFSRREKKRRKELLAERPIWSICRDAERLIDNKLWQIGCLQIANDRWLWTDHSRREFGEYWYSNEILKTTRDLRRAEQRKDIGSVAINAYKLGDLCQSFVTQVDHGLAFEKFHSVLERQRTV